MHRSFGRALWLRGVPTETTSTIYGHPSVDMTRRYLGIALSDMQKALMGYYVSRIVELRTEPARWRGMNPTEPNWGAISSATRERSRRESSSVLESRN
jgi:hypothetical protein